MKKESTTHEKQEYVSSGQCVETGNAPNAKVKLLSTNGETKNYVLVFYPGDEAISGLNTFAEKYNVKSAHYSAIGSAFSAKVGFFDFDRKKYKVISVGISEITSFIGNISLSKGKQVSHTHVNLGVEDGSVMGGHLLELFVGPTLEVFITVEPTALHKKLDTEYNAEVIDPFL